MEKVSREGFGLLTSAFAAVALAAALAFPASAITLRTKSDLRLWQTVTDRAAPISWPWEADADTARLTFSNHLTQAVSSVTVVRAAGATRGSCAHPVAAAMDEGLVVATLVQMAGGVEIARETAELAYVPGASGRAITVRTKTSRDWHRVERPRLAAFDAHWWNVTGPSGYEVLWSEDPRPQIVVREFGGVPVDWAELTFLRPGVMLFLR